MRIRLILLLILMAGWQAFSQQIVADAGNVAEQPVAFTGKTDPGNIMPEVIPVQVVNPEPSEVSSGFSGELPISPAGQDRGSMPWKVGLSGGAYLMADPGELIIELEVRVDRLRPEGGKIRVIFLSPDRKVLRDELIPLEIHTSGDTRYGQFRTELRTHVSHAGIYAFTLINPSDRHGIRTSWSMRTSARGYMLQTAGGHRDERHVEPIVILNPEKPMDICFFPRKGEFEIEAEALPADLKSLTLFDDKGKVVAEIPVVQEKENAIRQYLGGGISSDTEGSARVVIPAAKNRGQNLWRLHLPKGQAYVNIDGVTRWTADDLYPNLCFWTPDPDAWIPLPEFFWMVSPYQRHAWSERGTSGTVNFTIHNNSPVSRTYALNLEFPGQKWPVILPVKKVKLAAGQSQEVTLTYTVPQDGDTWTCYLRATPSGKTGLTTYASLTVRAGRAPALQPLDMPVVISPFVHENEQFGYLPEYPVGNQVYFDLENRPYVLTASHLHRQVDGVWTATELSRAVTRSEPAVGSSDWTSVTTKIGFDSENHLYVLAAADGKAALLHSADHGATFTAYVLPGGSGERGSFDFEQFSGHNVPEGPPPVIRLTRARPDDSNLPIARRDASIRWRQVNHLDLIVGEKSPDGTIRFVDPMRLTSSALGISLHSGNPSSVVSRGSKVHVVWGEATDPEASLTDVPGVPAYVATYDRITGELKKPVFMSFGPPPNDGHNTPSITMDSQGYLHILVGTHGRPFQYLRSLQPNDAYGGWTEATRTSTDELRQTYVGLVCDDQDALHVVFRLWRTGEEHLDGALWAALAYQRKLPGRDWEPPKILVMPPMADYSIYYHRLTIDRDGKLFLSYDYWSTLWFYRNDQRGAVPAGSGRPGAGWGRAVLTSGDGGNTWSLW